MFDQQNTNDPEEMTKEQRDKLELEQLKKRADQLSITYSNNIGLDTLREKVRAKLEGEEPSNDVDEDEKRAEEEAAVAEIKKLAEAPLEELPVAAASATSRGKNPFEPVAPMATQAAAAPNPVPAKVSLRAAKRDRLIKDKMRLVRCRIYNMDPKKKELHGEIISVGNELLGTVRKFIPFGEATDDGYHIPLIIYNQLASRKFLHVKTTRNPRNGQINVSTSWQREFNLEVLPPLTEAELNDLKQAQIAAGSVETVSAD